MDNNFREGFEKAAGILNPARLVRSIPRTGKALVGKANVQKPGLTDKIKQIQAKMGKEQANAAMKKVMMKKKLAL